MDRTLISFEQYSNVLGRTPQLHGLLYVKVGLSVHKLRNAVSSEHKSLARYVSTRVTEKLCSLKSILVGKCDDSR